VSAIDPRYVNWHKSTACTNGECLEVAYLGDRAMVRNSTAPRVFLHTSRFAWEVFIATVAPRRPDAGRQGNIGGAEKCRGRLALCWSQ